MTFLRSVKQSLFNFFYILTIFVTTFTMLPLPAVAATKDDKHSALYDTPFYSETEQCGGSSSADSGGAGDPSTARDALLKQDLDPKWVDVIIKNATKYQADPIAMASLLFWENRKFPEYKTSGWPVNPDRGAGPWQFTAGTWPGLSDADFVIGTQDPAISTPAAAKFVKSIGGVAGSKLGSISQNFGRGTNIKSMATVAKSYNSGGATYRAPGVANYGDSRIWTYPGGSWDSSKQQIIDDYIVSMTYVYYQIGNGTKVSYTNDPSYIHEALSKKDEVKAYSFGGGTGAQTPTDDGTGCGENTCSATGNGDTIVLDPGHSPPTPENDRDSKTGLYDFDYANQPEMNNAFTAATKIAEKLEAKGYDVVVTKKSVNDTFNLSERAKKINATHGALVFTMHSNQDGVNDLMYPDDQSKRSPKGSARKDGTDGLVYPEVAAPSKAFAEKMAPIIATGISKHYIAQSFNQAYPGGIVGNGKNVGNTPVQSILTSIPQVYSEVEESVLPSSDFIDAATKAIEAAVPASGGSAPAATSSPAPSPDSDSSCAPTGSIEAAVQKALEYSWSDGRKGLEMKPSYKEAVEAAQAKKEYVGGYRYPGIDCGGFITLVMRNSGADPNYNPKKSNTIGQKAYLKSSQKYENLGDLTDVSKLQPGDIAVNDSHTYMYVGSQPDFHGNSASASLDGYAPTANSAYFGFTWFRLKSGG